MDFDGRQNLVAKQREARSRPTEETNTSTRRNYWALSRLVTKTLGFACCCGDICSIGQNGDMSSVERTAMGTKQEECSERRRALFKLPSRWDFVYSPGLEENKGKQRRVNSVIKKLDSHCWRRIDSHENRRLRESL